MRSFGFFIIALTCAGLLSAPSRASQIARAATYAEIYDALTGTVSKKFYDPYFRGVDWHALVARTRPRALASRTDNEFLRISNGLLGPAACLPPRSKAPLANRPRLCQRPAAAGLPKRAPLRRGRPDAVRRL